MWKWIRIPKGIALLAFFLPWLTVSCSGQPLLSASGVGLAFGQVTSSLPTNQPGQPSGTGIDIWLVLAILAIAYGIWRSLAKQDKAEARNVMISSAAAIVLIWAGTSKYSKSALLAEAARKNGNGAIDQAAVAMLRVDWHFGYWLAMLALAVAGGMAWLVFSGRDGEVEQRVRGAMASGGSSARAPAPEPPPEVSERTCPTCGRGLPAASRFCPDDGTALD